MKRTAESNREPKGSHPHPELANDLRKPSRPLPSPFSLFPAPSLSLISSSQNVSRVKTGTRPERREDFPSKSQAEQDLQAGWYASPLFITQ